MTIHFRTTVLVQNSELENLHLRVLHGVLRFLAYFAWASHNFIRLLVKEVKSYNTINEQENPSVLIEKNQRISLDEIKFELKLGSLAPSAKGMCQISSYHTAKKVSCYISESTGQENVCTEEIYKGREVAIERNKQATPYISTKPELIYNETKNDMKELTTKSDQNTGNSKLLAEDTARRKARVKPIIHTSSYFEEHPSIARERKAKEILRIKEVKRFKQALANSYMHQVHGYVSRMADYYESFAAENHLEELRSSITKKSRHKFS